MLITPAPGANRGTLLDNLRSIRTNVSNLQGASYSDAYGRLLAYLAWANISVRLLRNQVRASDIDRLILTRQHAALLVAAGNLAGSHQQRLLNDLVDLEVTARIEAFGEAVQDLEDLVTTWPDNGDTAYLAADSSFYIQHPAMLEDVDFAGLLGLAAHRHVHLLFPAVVVDELDSLKETKGNARARWRAGYTLAVLDRVLDRNGIGYLRPSALTDSGAVTGGVSVQMLFDQPGHVRMPIADDEIVDRCLGAKVLAGQQGVKLLTYDTGQSTRARMNGLAVHKFRHDAGTGDEPDWAAEEAKQAGGNGGRAARRARQIAARESTEDREMSSVPAEH